MDLSKKVFGANVDQKIIEYINQLQQGRFEVEPNSPISVSYDTDTYLGDRTPFARMWTAVDISEFLSSCFGKRAVPIEVNLLF